MSGPLLSQTIPPDPNTNTRIIRARCSRSNPSVDGSVEESVAKGLRTPRTSTDILRTTMDILKTTMDILKTPMDILKTTMDNL